MQPTDGVVLTANDMRFALSVHVTDGAGNTYRLRPAAGGPPARESVGAEEFVFTGAPPAVSGRTGGRCQGR
jgi:hypothetical protein